MASFVTGGKTWILPTMDNDTTKPSTASSHTVKASTLPPAKFKEFLAGMGVLYTLYGITAVLAMFGILLGLLFTKPQLEIASNGGLIVPTAEPETFPFTALVLIMILPIAVYFIMEILGRSTMFDGKTGKRNTAIAIIIVALIFTTASVIVANDLNWLKNVKTSHYASTVKEWMMTRYGFEPYHMPEINKLVEGDKLYSNDASYPAHDVYLKQAEDSYLLVDAAGKELPLASTAK